MPVKLKPMFKKGWKQDENQRFGNCLVVQFINTLDGRILFEYAPALEDKTTWEDVFATLQVYTDKLELLKTIETKTTEKYI